MKEITVSLNLEDYNELLNIIEKTKRGSVPVWGRNTGFVDDYDYDYKNNDYDDYAGYQYLCMYSKDEAVKEVIKFNGKLNKKIQELKDEIARKPKEFCLVEIKKMSIWQFIKWRKK